MLLIPVGLIAAVFLHLWIKKSITKRINADASGRIDATKIDYSKYRG